MQENTMSSTLMQSPVTLTAGAVAEIKRLLNTNQDAEKTNLRIGVKGGGCSGLTYVLELDAKQADDDDIEIEGLHLIMKPAHALYLNGIEIDFSTGLDNRGFTFKNPNASSTCGCGTSFSV
jgi:iron-sulfur cluster assembly protein